MIIVVLVIGILAIFTFTKRSRRQVAQSKPETTVPSDVLPTSASNSQAYQSQTQTFGAVEVEAIPQKLRADEKIVFKLFLNTHSVELDYDYTAIAGLRDNQGSSYRALVWDGDQSGHHITGELTFEPLKEEAENITLELSGIDNKTNSFTWELLR